MHYNAVQCALSGRYIQIARKLERLQKIIDATKVKFDNLFKLKSKSSNLDKQIKQTRDLLKANEKAAKGYKSYADKYAKKSGLSDSLIKKIQSGDYSIKDYNSKTAEKINKYKEYWDNYKEAKQKVDELTTSIRELREERYQLYVDDAESNIEKLNAQKDIAVGYIKQNKYLDAQKKYLKQSYDYQIKIAELTKDEVKKSQLQAEYQQKLRDLEKEKFENIENNYSNRIMLLDESQKKIEDRISLLEAKGMTVNAKYYEGEIEYQKAIKAERESEYKALKDELAKMEASGMKGTSTWYDSVEALSKVEYEITACDTAIANMNNSITEVSETIINKVLEGVKSVSEEMDFMAGLMSKMDMFFEDSGAFTNEGLATLGSYIGGANTSQYKQTYVDGVVKAFEQAKKDGKLEFNYDGQLFTFNSFEQMANDELSWIEKLKEATQDYADSTNNAIDMMVEKYRAELSALKSIIDAKQEALNAEKDLRNYQKSIQDSVSNAASLQKQIAALQGNSSEENMMRVQKLQDELDKQQEDIADQEYDRYISDQEAMLDKLYSEYESLINQKTKDRDKLLVEAISIAKGTQDIIQKTFTEYGEKYNYNDYLGIIKAGLITLTGNDSPLENIKKNVFEAVQSEGEIGNIPTAIGEVKTSIDTISEKIKEILGSTSSNGNNTNSQSGNNTNDNNSNNNFKSISLQNSKESAAISYILTYSKKHNKDKEISDYSDVNQKIWKLTNGKILNTDGLKGLAKLLGVEYDNASKKGNLYKKLKSLGIQGFKRGGIAQLIKSSGEDGLTLARNGEGFIAPEHVKPIQDLVQLTPQLSDMLKPIVDLPKIPDIKPIDRNSNLAIDIGNIELNGVQDPKQFASQLVSAVQKDRTVQNTLRELTDIPVNRNYNRLSVNKYK